MNIAKILKDCPKGTKLYSPLCGDCTLYDVNDYNIRINTPNKDTLICLYHDGRYCSNGEIMLFPKGKTTWDGFVPSIKFKDGDIVTGKNCACSYIAIFRESIDDISFSNHVCLTSFGRFNIDNISDNANLRLATEEEKQKLFKEIKERGYKWNSETKTLEKLVEPKFKVGDRIKEKQSNIIGEIIDVQKNKYNVKIDDKGLYLYFREQDNFELVPDKFDITTLKPFDKVLVRDDNERCWDCELFNSYRRDEHYPFFGIAACYKQCVPYKGNEHLLATTNDCDEFYKTW